MSSNDGISSLLMVLLMVAGAVLAILCVIFIMLKLKEVTKGKNKNANDNDEVHTDGKQTITSYNKQSIFKFMNFDKIEDNMIVQKNGKRFLMVVECQGVNYDLMSSLEKNSVEQGFLQFLNTLRYQIQIFVQTRTVNLGSSIASYRTRVDDAANSLAEKQSEYNRKLRSGEYTEKELEKERLEVVRQRHLYEYGADIVANTEKMSLNKNILSKFYYIIIPYYLEEDEGKLGKEEISNLAFSELYTKAQTIINSLAVCGVKGKVLDSMQLSEFLYTVYNRDESEVVDFKRTMSSGYEELYSTAPNVLDKRMAALNQKINDEAMEKANKVVYDVMADNEKAREVRSREAQLNELIDQIAIDFIQDNKRTLGAEVTNEAVKRISESEDKQKGGEDNVKESKKTTRRKTTKSA